MTRSSRCVHVLGCGVLALLLTALGCASDAGVPTAPTAGAPAAPATANAVPATSYDIYRVALGQLGPLGNGHPLVVREDTATFAWCPVPTGSGAASEWREAVESYVAANRTAQRLADGQNLGTAYLVITNQRYAEFFGSSNLADSWRRFGESYPSSTLVTFSAVGFNADGTRAVVQVGMGCGGLCGAWRDVYLERRGATWVAAPIRTCSAIS